MGSRGYHDIEEPIHVVRLSPFYLGVYPVTQGQFSVWTGAAGIEHRNHFDGRPDHPAESMTWFECRDFCAWLTARCGKAIPTGYVAGLPLECQWEYACRLMKHDGTPFSVDTDYYSGDGEAALAEVGWFGEDWDDGSTHAVGSVEKRPTDYGLYDMHGNVWEWCKDAYDGSAYKKRADGESDPCVSAADVGEREKTAQRVIRGGSWGDSAGICRAAYRSWWYPGLRFRVRGFRVCLFFGPSCTTGAETGAVSECDTGDKARRQAAASKVRHGDNAEVDLSEAELPDLE